MANFEVGCYPTDPYVLWVHQWRNASADWISGQMNWIYPCPFDKFHFPYMCSMCKRGKITNTPVLQCTKCKVATYCCREHQVKAWKEHKEACKYFKSYFEHAYNADLIKSPSAWKYHLLKGMGTLRGMAGAQDPLQCTINRDEWMFQRHCQACFFNPAARQPAAHQNDSVLVECPTCHCAAHCNNPNCTKIFNLLHDAQACEKYLIGFAIVVMTMQNEGQNWVFATESREAVTNPPAGWFEYFTRKMADMNVSFMLKLPPAMAMATDFLSIPLTIVNSLRLAYGTAQLASMKRIEIHLLGVDLTECMFADRKYHEILHWLPACEELVTYLIGPGQVTKTEPGALTRVYDGNPAERVCDGCKAAGVKHYMRFAHGKYHDIVAPPGTSPHNNPHNKLLLDSATLTIACHSGMHDEQGPQGRPLDLSAMWEPTVRLLSQSNVPCVWTSWNAEEGTLDAQKLTSWGARVIVDTQLNPFRGLRPYPEIGEDNRFYYTNNYVVMTRGKTT